MAYKRHSQPVDLTGCNRVNDRPKTREKWRKKNSGLPLDMFFKRQALAEAALRETANPDYHDMSGEPITDYFGNALPPELDINGNPIIDDKAYSCGGKKTEQTTEVNYSCQDENEPCNDLESIFGEETPLCFPVCDPEPARHFARADDGKFDLGIDMYTEDGELLFEICGMFIPESKIKYWRAYSGR